MLRDEIAAAIAAAVGNGMSEKYGTHADAAIAVFKEHQSHRLKEAEYLLKWAAEIMEAKKINADNWYRDYELWQRDMELEQSK